MSEMNCPEYSDIELPKFGELSFNIDSLDYNIRLQLYVFYLISAMYYTRLLFTSFN